MEVSSTNLSRPNLSCPLVPSHSLPLSLPGPGIGSWCAGGSFRWSRSSPVHTSQHAEAKPAWMSRVRSHSPLSPASLTPLYPRTPYPFLFLAQELGLGVRAEASDGQEAALCTRPSTRGPTQLEHGGELYPTNPSRPSLTLPACALALLTPPHWPRNWVLVCGRKLQMVKKQPCA
jgi:hypothetical protein